MSERAKTGSPEDAGRKGMDDISRRGFPRPAAAGAGAAAAAAGMSKVAKATVGGARSARLDGIESATGKGP